MEKKLSKLKFALAGFSLIILANGFIDVFALFFNIPVINFVVMGVCAVAWLMVLLGFFGARNIRREFKYGSNAAFLGIAALAGQGFFALKEYRAGLGESIHMSLEVMFGEYWSNLFMLIAIYMAMVGLGQLLAKSGEVRRGKKSKSLGKVCVLTTLATYLLYPMVQIFPEVLGMILAIVVIVAGVIAQFMMVNYINNGYRDIDID